MGGWIECVVSIMKKKKKQLWDIKGHKLILNADLIKHPHLNSTSTGFPTKPTS